MRIISGIFKGKKIFEPEDKVTRPLKDLVKESIFNIINHSNKFEMQISNSIILDLFSGVGSFGLEAISRGASYTVFVENYPQVLKILKNNISNLKYDNKSKVIDIDAFKINKNIFKENLKFQIIFCDPPYKEKKIKLLLENIIEMDVLDKNGIIIIHRRKGDLDIYPKKFKIINTKNYGLSSFVFGRKSN